MDLEARDFARAETKPPPYFPPIVVNRAARPVRSQMRVVLLNLAGGSRLNAVVDCLKRPPLRDADVILLCEADSGTRRSRRLDVTSELAAALEMSYAYVPEFGFKRGESGGDGKFFAHFCNSILCTQAPFDAVSVAVPSPLPPRAISRRPAR